MKRANERRSEKKEKQYKLRNSIRCNQSALARYLDVETVELYENCIVCGRRPKRIEERDREMGKGSRLAACTTGQERSRVNEIQIPLRRKPSRSVAPYGLPTPRHCALGCRLWATSHANSDKVPLSFSRFLSRSLLLTSSFSCLSYCLQRTADVPSSSLSAYRLYVTLFFSLLLCLSGFVRRAIPTRSIPGAPQPPRTRAREYLSPGHLRAD